MNSDKDNQDQTFKLPTDRGLDNNNNTAADLVRKRLNNIYNNEPDVVEKATESAQQPVKTRSKHQRYMAELTASGKDFAEIQTAWHEYYTKLSDKDKHDVWNEFYSAQGHRPKSDGQYKSYQTASIAQPSTNSSTVTPVFGQVSPIKAKVTRPESVADIKKQIVSKVNTRGKLSRNQHLRSLMFGLSAGAVTVAIMLFGFFNERIIAPFITPSRNVSSTPLITDGVSGAVGGEPRLIIPKINVELPVIYDVKTVQEDDVQAGLERGVVHYITTSNPGEKGNGAIFGHSSNNILNKGKYKFAFVLLSRLEDGDTFYIEKDGIRYVYRIFKKEVVKPSQVDVLHNVPGKTSTMALITCDPPGTTINRLVVWGEQISPDPVDNIASSAKQTTTEPAILAGNAPSLWSRMWNSIF